ncbi:AsmA family protein [Azospirillum sp. INR13]|uniref:AsmA family protein n=1 Tax=Azospirillum sp. INR13 TaxID=2596919 RepID=UPI0018924954|nr:AsmA family protein [Azospirillum sp. INR13]MBF5094832.1 AsmA family protein [Azospirillum sp. INR13]
MKKLLIALIVIVGIVAVAVAALPFILTGDFVAEKVAAAVKERTGRDLTLRIDSLSLFPDLKARVESATLSDVPDSGRPAMLELGPTEFEVALWPLLRALFRLIV